MTEVIENYPIKKYDVKKLFTSDKDKKGIPDFLYYRGDISLLEGNVVAVIGSREVSARGKEAAKNITRELCKRGKTILNGLAIGCDAAALWETVECGGKGIAVMPCGLDEIYPKSNLNLAEAILQNGGCLVSEYQAGIKPRKESFVARDRLQAYFSDLVIVVESNEGSGTWHTVEYAKRYQRLVACYMGIKDSENKGNDILVGNKKAYALNDDELDYFLKMSESRNEQIVLPI